MIVGIGIDIVQVSRVAELVQNTNESFAKKILSEEELITHHFKLTNHRFLAKRFALKEAIAKALGVGIGNKLSFKDITITNDENGKPLCTVVGYEHIQLHISVADEREYVAAQAIATPI